MMLRKPCPDMQPYRWEVERFILARVIVAPSGCWIWQKQLNTGGYAACWFKGRSWIVTRLVYSAACGGFDPQLDVCHTCDTPACVSPLHLWLGNRKQNSQDCIKKGRHYKAVRTHCPRGHAYAEHGSSHSKNPNWRVCKVCGRARERIAAGWSEDLAYSLPKQEFGFRPVGLGSGRKVRIGRPSNMKQSHCQRGHALEGENIYKKSGGGRQCKICHDAAVIRLRAERQAQQVNGTPDGR